MPEVPPKGLDLGLGVAFEFVEAPRGGGEEVGKREQEEIEVLWSGRMEEWEERRRRRQGWLPSPQQGAQDFLHVASHGGFILTLLPFFLFDPVTMDLANPPFNDRPSSVRGATLSPPPAGTPLP